MRHTAEQGFVFVVDSVPEYKVYNLLVCRSSLAVALL